MSAPPIDSQPADNSPTEARQRVRITYEKGEVIKFISHMDEFRLWERTLRRADLPLLYKQGFNPQPHIQFASALGVGITGTREMLDITLSPPLPLGELRTRIEQKLPPGVALHAIEDVPLKTTALQSVQIGADYTIIIFAEPGEISETLLQARIDDLMAQSEIWRERERKKRKYTYNLRPLVFELRYVGYDADAEEHHIFLRVQQRPGATGRPDEVIDALGFDDFARTLRRDKLYFEGVAEDETVFAAYPVVDKDKITRYLTPKRNKRRGRGRNQPAKYEREAKDVGRSINERAADEFD